MSLFSYLLQSFLRDRALKGSSPSNLFTQPSKPTERKEETFSIPYNVLQEHGVILAGAGHGKTQLLQHFILSGLHQYPPMSYWVIDSQGEMINKLSRLAFFSPDAEEILSEKLIIIDPEDISPPALNLFDIPGNDATTDSLFMYMFSAIDNSLTPQMSTVVTYLMRLMRVIPDATIDTLRKVLEDRSKTPQSSPWSQYYSLLEETAQDFFANHFFQPGPMQITRNSIARRLYALLANNTFRAMFGATQNKFNALQAMQEGKIVLINTSQKMLADGSPVLGRFFIAQALAAAYQLPTHQGCKAILVVDEFSEYVDYQIERILSTSRKYGLGLWTASQFLSQLDQLTKDAIFGNTTTKLVGAVSYQDANILAREMNIDTDLIRKLKKYKDRAEFACYVRSQTDKAFTYVIPFFQVENFPKMTEGQYQRLRQTNRELYGASTEPPAPKPTILTHDATVTFPDYDITTPCLLDSGASITTIPADELIISNNTASFFFRGKTITEPIVRTITIGGFSNELLSCPIIRLRIQIHSHIAFEEVALNRPNTTILIGRSFMAGRIIVDPSKGSNKKW